jgi:endonuclease III
MDSSKLIEYVKSLPSYSEELNLDLTKPEDRFKWFIASILFSKRISFKVAERTFNKFIENGLKTPNSILDAGWDNIVQILDSGGYTRYDFSTATYLIENMKKLLEEYVNLEELQKRATDPADLEKRLIEFKGVGPVTVNIFLIELRGIWEKLDPNLQKLL